MQRDGSKRGRPVPTAKAAIEIAKAEAKQIMAL
jgi:hypothetical protein